MENREIKFRGKRIDNGEWVYGYIYRHDPPLQCFGGTGNILPSFAILKTGFADWNMPRPVEQHEVDGKTVGQYTGLKDKNGKEIYEGDVLRHNYKFYGEPIEYTKDLELIEGSEVGYITFKKGCFTYISREGKSEMCGSIDPDEDDILDMEVYNFEVIGNIFDTPELIGGK